MSQFGQRIMEEVREVIPPTIFFLISFHIIALFRALVLRQYGVEISALAGATVAALVVAKVVLLADLLPFVNRFPGKLGADEVRRMFFGPGGARRSGVA